MSRSIESGDEVECVQGRQIRHVSRSIEIAEEADHLNIDTIAPADAAIQRAWLITRNRVVCSYGRFLFVRLDFAPETRRRQALPPAK